MMDLPWHDLDKYVTAVPRLSRDSPEALLETIAMARKEYHKATMEGKDATWWKDETTNNSISIYLVICGEFCDDDLRACGISYSISMMIDEACMDPLFSYGKLKTWW